MKLSDLYQQYRHQLKQAGVDNPDLDARILIKEALGVSDVDILTNKDALATDTELSKLKAWMDRRLAGEPVSRILGQREFWGLPFHVTPDVLDPRPDTETIIEAALRRYCDNPPETILDIGTGSGCILISLLHEWPDSQGTGVDISEEALIVARKNAKNNNVFARSNFVQGDMCSSVEGKFDLIVSNPPYIPNRDVESLAKEVKNHDPILALEGGEDGLKFIKEIVMGINTLWKTGGICFLEIGFGQSKDVVRLVEDAGLSVTAIHADLAGVERVVEISCGDK